MLAAWTTTSSGPPSVPLSKDHRILSQQGRFRAPLLFLCSAAGLAGWVSLANQLDGQNGLRGPAKLGGRAMFTELGALPGLDHRPVRSCGRGESPHDAPLTGPRHPTTAVRVDESDPGVARSQAEIVVGLSVILHKVAPANTTSEGPRRQDSRPGQDHAMRRTGTSRMAAWDRR